MCIMYVFALLYTLCLRIMNMYHYMYRQPSSTNTAYACTRPETAGLSRGRRITWKRRGASPVVFDAREREAQFG
jgi:hypothetical protein